MIEVMQTIASFFVLGGVAALTPLILYLWFFAVAYFVNSNRSNQETAQPLTRFAFIVPAHNEEAGITTTVNNLLAVNYPKELLDVVVIADNCSDSTAAKALSAGAKCLERTDPDLRGKGYALRLAFTKLLSDNYDAFIVIDADSVVSNDFLSRMDTRLQRGEQVVQAYYGLSNPDASILTYLFQVGSLIENKLFWESKQIFGLPIMLRGNGMCFTRQIVEQYPWDAFSIVEDTEYGIKLVDQGVHICFATETGVYARQPETLDQAFAQRVRWASGNSSLTKGRAIDLIAKGVSGKKANQADLGISLLVGSKPLLLVVTLVLLLLAWFAHMPVLAWWASLLMLAQLLYIGIGIVLQGITLQNMYRLLVSPFYMAWLCMVSILGLMGFRKNQWVRTSRQ